MISSLHPRSVIALWLLNIWAVQAFTVVPEHVAVGISRHDDGTWTDGTLCTSTALFMGKKKKNKLSMQEKLAKRAKRLVSTKLDLPPPQLDFKTPAAKPSEALLTKQKAEAEKAALASSGATTTTTPGLDASKKITDPDTAEQKAKQLLKAQRDSVTMLTLVKERIDALPVDAIQASLADQGYHVVDGFLGDDDIIAALNEEGSDVLSMMELDLSNIGSGEYIIGVKGGEDQYKACPRTIEFVVSATKHTATHLKMAEEISDGASMAYLRTFDRKALKASLALLTGGEDEGSLFAASASKPFAVVAGEDNDQRKLSMFYYIVPQSWDEKCGGGMTFDGSTPTKVAAASDRLIIFNSDTAKVQQDMWRGDDSDDHQMGTRLELHLVKK